MTKGLFALLAALFLGFSATAKAEPLIFNFSFIGSTGGFGGEGAALGPVTGQLTFAETGNVRPTNITILTAPYPMETPPFFDLSYYQDGNFTVSETSAIANAYSAADLEHSIQLNLNTTLGTWYNYQNITTRDPSNSTLVITPVPEPSAYALLGLGLLGLFATRRFQLRKVSL